MSKIEIRNLSFTYEDNHQRFEALKKIDLSIREGEFVCILGPSGCGKSTLLTVLEGLEKSTDGEILIDGEKVEGPGKNRAVVFQHYSLFPWLTARDNVIFGIKQSGKKYTRAERKELADGYLKSVELEEAAKKYPSQLSGGMQQRVGIAAAMLLNPSVLMADEPTSALDVTVQKQVVEEMLMVRERFGTSILLVTHNMGVIRAMADKVLVLHEGEIMEYGVTEEVFEHPRSEYTKKLLAAVPKLRR